jgi:hypothetical protein
VRKQDWIDMYPLMKLINRVSSAREYIIFKDNIDWMKNYNSVTTNLHFHWMLKMNDKCVMIYTYGELADFLNSIDEDKRIEIYLDNINKIFKT